MSAIKACTVCGRRSLSRRCAEHAIPARGHAHRKAAKQTLREEYVCAICETPGTDADPLVAGHVIARAHGGPDTRENMRAVHASCNALQGAAEMVITS